MVHHKKSYIWEWKIIFKDHWEEIKSAAIKVKTAEKVHKINVWKTDDVYRISMSPYYHEKNYSCIILIKYMFL